MNQQPSDVGFYDVENKSKQAGRILANFREIFYATVRDSNGFWVAKIGVASFATHFDVLKHPIGWLLIHFS
jgi:hypothetical protein